MSDDPTGPRPASDGADGPMSLDALTEEVLPALIARLRSSRLGELEVGGTGWRVRLRRDPESTRRRPDTALHDAGADAGAEPGPIEHSLACSPAVGYFQPAAGLAMGATVQAGDSLGSVDVLGIVQDVRAPSDGIISRVLAEPGQAVEYGQALVAVDPLGAALDEQLMADEWAAG